MKAIMDVVVAPTHGGGTCIRKIFEVPFAPFKGMDISCGAWKSERKVISVTLCLDDGDPYIHIGMGIDEVKTDDEMDKRLAVYKMHGWKEPTLND